MFVLYIFEGLFAPSVSLIYFKYCKPIISLKYLFDFSSKWLLTHSIINVAIIMKRQDSWDLIRKHFCIYFPRCTCSVVEILPSPTTRVNLTTFLLTSRKEKGPGLLKIANPASIWWLNMSILYNNQSFQLHWKVTFYSFTSCLLEACCTWVSFGKMISFLFLTDPPGSKWGMEWRVAAGFKER